MQGGVPFTQTAAMDLGLSFAVCAYGGFACWIVAGLTSLLTNWRHLHLLESDPAYRQLVFITASNMATRNQQERNTLGLGVMMVQNNVQERARQGQEREMV